MLRALRSLFVFAALLAASFAAAQSVRWEPAGGTLGRDQISSITLVFDNAAPTAAPVPPTVPGLEFFENPRRSENTSIRMGTGTRTVQQRTISYTYRIRPTLSDGDVRIPAFTVDTDAGQLSVPAAGFTLAAATVGQTGLPLEKIASTRFVPPAAPLWAGEVFRLAHVLDVERRYATNDILAAPLDWAPAPLIAEEWSRPSGTEAQRDGQNRYLVTWQTRAIAPLPATSLALSPATQLVSLPTGTSSSFFLGQTLYEQFTLTTLPATISVRRLPLPAPDDFDGAVGQFTLASNIVPEKAAVGEPVTWTLSLDGTGNWPVIDRLPARELPQAFRVVSPRAQKTPKNNALFDATLTEDLVLIPQRPGRYTLGPYALSIFNPATGAYETLRTQPVTIEITAAAPLPGATTAGTNGESPTEAPDDHSPRTPTPPANVASLPSDPLSAGLVSPAPLPHWTLALRWTLAALAIPALLWAVLALLHARRHDPLRARRIAHARLVKLLPQLDAASREQGAENQTGAHSALNSRLLAWQQATRELFDLGSLTPTASDIADPAWSRLWNETERALYRPASQLSPEWHAQAREALRRATPPSRSIFAALRPAHLFGRALLFGVVLHALFGLAPSSIAAPASADPASLYARGDFPAAEAAWRRAVAADPRDAAPRHNLALALAQQGRWDEAAAHAYAAALHAPADPALERLLDATRPRAAYAPPHIPSLARRLAVHDWQLLALAAALVLLAFVPSAYLIARFSRGAFGQAAFYFGHLSLVIAAAAFVASLLALRAHGPAAASDAVLVWKTDTLRAVPTELGDQKVTADLPAGTLARVDKDFLGWRRLVLRDGNTGWVRAESLVGLWDNP